MRVSTPHTSSRSCAAAAAAASRRAASPWRAPRAVRRRLAGAGDASGAGGDAPRPALGSGALAIAMSSVRSSSPASGPR
jgi:hypothetical protein